MSLTFFQSIGDGKKANIIVLFRQLILFIPTILLFPKLFGSIAIWYAEPIVDFIIILIGLFLMLKEIKKMDREKY